MKFTAHYMKKAPNVLQIGGANKTEYYRTIHTDSINDAIKTAEHYVRNGYICTGVKQQLGKE